MISNEMKSSQAKLDGAWPCNTWFQRRLAIVKQREAREVLSQKGGDTNVDQGWKEASGVGLPTKSKVPQA